MNLLVIIDFIIILQHWVALARTNHFSLNSVEKHNIENTIQKKQQKIENFSNESSSEVESYSSKYCRDEEYLQKFISYDNKTQKLLVTWHRTKAGEYAVLPNICLADNGLPIRRRCYRFDEATQWEKYNNQSVLIDCRVSMFCKPEIFNHYVKQINGEVAAHQNIWKQAKIGEYSGLRDLCLQPNGLHLTRKCFYDVKDKTAKWTSIDHLKNVNCLQHTLQHIITNELNLLQENITRSNVFLRDTTKRQQTVRNLLDLLQKPKIKLLPADIHLTSCMLNRIITNYQDAELSKDVLKIFRKLMSADSVVLRMSAVINSTNILLETFEFYMDSIAEKLVSNSNCHVVPLEISSVLPLSDRNDSTVEILNLSNIGVYAHFASNISVFFVNPSCSHITGIAIYNSYLQKKYMTQQQHQQQQQQSRIKYDSVNDFYYRFIYMNESINDLLRETNLKLASFIPIDIWNSLQLTFNNSFLETQVIVFKIYAHDSLFIEQNLLRSRKPFSKILSISLPGFTDQLPASLPFILRHNKFEPNLVSNVNTGCGYWNYSTWTSSGIYTNLSQNFVTDDLILCFTNHLTQFSYLIGGSYRQNDLSNEILVTPVHQKALDIISLIGCILSLLGLLGIWITALLFKSWRSQASNKVLLNMCVALTLQMVLLLFVNTDHITEALVESHSYTKCVLLGALLQYSLLVLFTWMLIIAFLQFQRYVTVIGIQRPRHYILKSALLAWSLPLIPTLLVALLDSESYIPSSYQLNTDTGICYPSGNALHFGVILPVSLIVLANLSIFFYVIYSISRTIRMSVQRYEKRMVIKQIRLSILLFFLLGLSWIFALLAFMKAGIIFSYLFCLTATLQGFVLFIYFVIIDEIARNSWRNLLFSTCAKKTRSEKSTELQSMTTATTSLTQDMNS